MAEITNWRQIIDFNIIPNQFHRDRSGFLCRFLTNPARFLAMTYTRIYLKNIGISDKPISGRFSPRKFGVIERKFPNFLTVTYVTLPPVDDDSTEYCIAYAIVNNIDTREDILYTVAKMATGAICIGKVDENGKHTVLGEAGNSANENIERIYALTKPSEPTSSIEVTKTVHPDGSYVECIIDNRTNKGEITEYDAQGNRICTHYGIFLPSPEIPDDDEFDDYLHYLKSHGGNG